MEKRNLFSPYILDTSKLEHLLRPPPEDISILCRSCDITTCYVPLLEFIVLLDLQQELKFRISKRFPGDVGLCTTLAEILI